MINVSNEFKLTIANDKVATEETAKATINLADGTVLDITEEDIVVRGLKINDSTSPSNNFQIGSAIINQCTLMLNNVEHKFDAYDFTDAVIRPYTGLKLSNGIEWLKKGVFTVDDPTVASSIVNLITLDNMAKFDTTFSEVSIVFPCTQLQLLQALCSHCGVPLATVSFLNDNFVINRRPNDKAMTCREIVSYIAQNSGNFARCNTDGALELKWYDIGVFEISDSIDGGTFDSNTPFASGGSADGGNFTDYNSGDNIDGGTFLDMERYHHIYALGQATIGTDDVIITGVQVKAQGMESDYGETSLFGSTGYVIEINNPLIQENTAAIIANSVGAKIVGMRFRTCSVSALADPSREAGDVAYLSYKNNTYQMLLTNVTYQIGTNDTISCDAETPSRKQSVRFDAQTKTIVTARNIVRQEISTYDLSVKQLNDLVMHSFGVYHTSEKLEDGSAIEYSHDKPTLEESQNIWKQTTDTFTVSNDGGTTWRGMDADGNMVVTVLNALGINAEWIKVGTLKGIRIEANTGKIGPYDISDSGLTSNTMQFFDDGNYPLIWMTKPGPGGWGANGSGRANYEPSVAIVRDIVDGVETNVYILARDDTTGTKGQVSIDKIDLATNAYLKRVKLTNTGLDIQDFETGMSTILQGSTLTMTNGGYTFLIVMDPTDGTTYMQGSKIMINGHEFI